MEWILLFHMLEHFKDPATLDTGSIALISGLTLGVLLGIFLKGW
jgi:hypothetical protein